jgi:hypothetical protein
MIRRPWFVLTHGSGDILWLRLRRVVRPLVIEPPRGDLI